MVLTSKILGTSVILAVSLFLAGCPVPIPSGYASSSRENLSAEVTDQLVPGVTTREEVLLLLGEPDGVGPNASWLAYGSVRGEGGVVFVIFAGGSAAGAGGEKMEYRRLIARFDERGVMTNAQFVDRECWEGIGGMGNAGGRTEPCIQANAPDSSELTVKEIADRETAYQSGELPIPEDLGAFAIGHAELITPGWTTGLAAAAAAGENTRLTKDLYDSGQWEALARVVLNDRYGDDLRWYYLGRAAEGMALCDVALRYYCISRERSGSFSTRCLAGACAGIKLPEALDDRLVAIEAMRTTGKCSVPRNINPKP
jgi:outer membrane protein assembly factor BamE (lipoprotein component of BamABCDE complex)